MSDRALAFTIKAFAKFAKEHGVRYTLNAITTRRVNGQMKRLNRSILEGIGANTETKVRRDERLGDVVWGINHCVGETTGYLLEALMFMHTSGVMADLVTGKENNSERQDRKRRGKTLSGAEVSGKAIGDASGVRAALGSAGGAQTSCRGYGDNDW